MIRVVRPYAPPPAPPATGNFRADTEALRTYITRDLMPYHFDHINELISSFNNGSQGEGKPLTISGGTLMPDSFIHHVTNNATITTITVPAHFPFAGQLTLIADAGFTLQTGGNIANTKVLTAGTNATLTYSIQSGKWFVISLVSSLGDVTDFAAWQAATAYLLQDSIIDPNGNLQAATTAGTSGASIPTFNLVVSGTTNDGTVVWTNRGAPPVPPTRFTVRAVDVNHRSIIDVSQAHPNKSIDNIPDGATRFASPANLTAATDGQIPIGKTGTGVQLSTLSAGAGVSVTNNPGAVQISNSGVTETLPGPGISLSASAGSVTINNTGVLTLGSGGGITVSAASGNITLGSAVGGDGSGTVAALVINKTTTVAAGGFDFHYAEVANGGGAAPTFGTIGGSGPAAAAQDGWLKVQVNGVNAWLPVWK